MINLEGEEDNGARSSSFYELISRCSLVYGGRGKSSMHPKREAISGSPPLFANSALLGANCILPPRSTRSESFEFAN